jgi:hypothetical protein
MHMSESAWTGLDPGQGFMDLLRVRGEVGKHYPGGKDGDAIRRLEIRSKVVIGSLAYLDQVSIRGVLIVKVESQKPSGQCGREGCACLCWLMSCCRRRGGFRRRSCLKLHDRLFLAGIEELEVLLPKAIHPLTLRVTHDYPHHHQVTGYL